MWYYKMQIKMGRRCRKIMLLSKNYWRHLKSEIDIILYLLLIPGFDKVFIMGGL